MEFSRPPQTATATATTFLNHRDIEIMRAMLEAARHKSRRQPCGINRQLEIPEESFLESYREREREKYICVNICTDRKRKK